MERKRAGKNLIKNTLLVLARKKSREREREGGEGEREREMKLIYDPFAIL